ncbi:MAG: hypothetical protein HS126_08995 [Anaerolineales bacterium]|nr:hypothetical protein [Anaerolineales bacterium]
MAQSNGELIKALRETMARLTGGARYEWGHMARCNCGHLVQTITQMTDHEIARSVDFELDEWSEYAKDYCESSGHKVDDLFIILQGVGFSHQDVIHLENLSDTRVLDRLPGGRRYLQRNQVEDVTLYMQTLADMLENENSG